MNYQPTINEMSPQPITHNLLPALKVCGLTKKDQIQELIAMTVDFLGFIFYDKSPRYVLDHLSLTDIAMIDHPGKVGVFVNEDRDKLVAIATTAQLNFIQLHGNENESFIEELRKKLNPGIEIIKVIRIGTDDLENKNKIKQVLNYPSAIINYILFDTDSKAFGGTGKQFDWSLLNELEISRPYFLSGGISEEHIGNIELLSQKPFALDINSKFEIYPGYKDIDRIKEFMIQYQQNL